MTIEEQRARRITLSNHPFPKNIEENEETMAIRRYYDRLKLEQQQFVAYALIQSHEVRVTAAHNGAYNDGGAAMLEVAILAWVEGLFAVQPTGGRLGRIAKEFARDHDPDYKQYLALKAKFE